MPNEKSGLADDQAGTGLLATSQLPPPLNWVAGFIDKYFTRMPQAVQVSVFSIFVLYLIVASVKVFAPEMWDNFWTNDVEIQGVLTKPNWGGVEDTTGTQFLSGTRLYVTKDHPNPNSPKYYFRWILKADRQKLDDPVFFSVMDGTIDRGMLMSTPRQLLDRRIGEYVRLEFEDIPSTGKVQIGFFEDTSGMKTASLAFIGQGSPLQQTEKSYISKKPVGPDSVGIFLQRLLRPEYASAELRIRQLLVGGGIPAMKVVADSLRNAVLDRRTSAAAMYALALSDYPLLSLFSTSKSYSKVFDDPFYDRASRLLYEGNRKESTYMATLFHNLQDARSLKSVFDAYDKSTSDVSRGLCVYIVSAFAENSSPSLRNNLIAKLRALEKQTTSKDLKNALEETQIKLEKSLQRDEKLK